MGKYHLTEPGIYKPDQYWGSLTVNGQTIHFCPKDIANDVKEKFNISNENVVKLHISFNPEQRKRLKQEFPGQKDNIQSLSATGIFEDLMSAIDKDGKFGLRLFEIKMEGSRQDKDILIHCSAGQNRTPVGVVLYMMKFHRLSYEDASRAFEKALEDCDIRGNRTPEIQLNVNKHYTHVLNYAKIVYSQQNLAQPSSSSSVTTSESQSSKTSTAKTSKKRPLEKEIAKAPSKAAKSTQKKKVKQSTRSREKEPADEEEMEETLGRKKRASAKRPAKKPRKAISKTQRKSKKTAKKAAKVVINETSQRKNFADRETETEGEKFIERYNKRKEAQGKREGQQIQRTINRPRPATQLGARNRWGRDEKGHSLRVSKKPDFFDPSSDNSSRYSR